MWKRIHVTSSDLHFRHRLIIHVAFSHDSQLFPSSLRGEGEVWAKDHRGYWTWIHRKELRNLVDVLFALFLIHLKCNQRRTDWMSSLLHIFRGFWANFHFRGPPITQEPCGHLDGKTVYTVRLSFVMQGNTEHDHSTKRCASSVTIWILSRSISNASLATS